MCQSLSAQELLNRVIHYYPHYHNPGEIDEMNCYHIHPIVGFQFAIDHGISYETDLPFVAYRMDTPLHVGGKHEVFFYVVSSFITYNNYKLIYHES